MDLHGSRNLTRISPKFHGFGLDLHGSGRDGSQKFTESLPEFHGSGVDLNGSRVDHGISQPFHRNCMDLEWISMDLGGSLNYK